MFILQNYIPFGKLVFQLSPIPRWHYVLGSWNGKVKYGTFRTCFKMEAFSMYCEKVYLWKIAIRWTRTEISQGLKKVVWVMLHIFWDQKMALWTQNWEKGNIKSQIDVQTALQTRAVWMQRPSTLAHPTLTRITPVCIRLEQFTELSTKNSTVRSWRENGNLISWSMKKQTKSRKCLNVARDLLGGRQTSDEFHHRRWDLGTVLRCHLQT